jgi:hypothetical protein
MKYIYGILSLIAIFGLFSAFDMANGYEPLKAGLIGLSSAIVLVIILKKVGEFE